MLFSHWQAGSRVEAPGLEGEATPESASPSLGLISFSSDTKLSPLGTESLSSN